ncbi:MAG: hypothetical protein ABIL09_00150 [Gemmatimonadota bacterium]
MANWYKLVLGGDDPELRAEVSRQLAAQIVPGTTLRAGAVVEFVRQGHLHCGLVRPSPAPGRSVALLDTEGREVTVRRERILHTVTEGIPFASRSAALEALREADARREWVRRGLDMSALWELARGEPGQSQWVFDELASLCCRSAADPVERAALLRALWRGDWFERCGAAWRPRSEPAVLDRAARRRQAQGEARDEAALGRWLRTVGKDPSEPSPPGAERALALLEEVALYGVEAPRASAAAGLMKAAHMHGPHAAFETLVRLGRWSPDENLELKRWAVPVEFGDAAAAEARQIAAAGARAWPLAGRGARRIWLGRPAGLARAGQACGCAVRVQRRLRGFRVSLYLSAPALLVPAGSRLDEEARTRGVRLHLPEAEIPLLPEEVGEAVALRASRLTPCLALDLRLDRTLTLRRCRLRLRRVRPGGILRDGDVGPPLLLEVAADLRQQRLAAGAVLFPSRPRPVVAGGLRLEPPAGEVTRALEEYLLLAAAACGALCQRQGIPALYRVQAAPSGGTGGRALDPVAAHEVARRLPRTAVQVRAEPNPGFGLPACATVERPLEAYTDLVVQRQLIAWLVDGRPSCHEAGLQRVVEDTAAAREAALAVGRAARRYWLLKLLEGREGEEVEALVLERVGAGYVVELEESGYRDYVTASGELWARPGDRLRVFVERASARRDEMRLARPRPAGGRSSPQAG